MGFFKRFNRKCENCGGNCLKKKSNYCGNCGYPTPKFLSEVDNPDEVKQKALAQSLTIRERVKCHGLINVMREFGFINDEKANELIKAGRDLLKMLEEGQDVLNNSL